MEIVPHKVVACRDTPLRQNGIHVGSRQIYLALLVQVVDFYLFVVVVHIVCAVKSIFGIGQGSELAYVLGKTALNERIIVPYTLAATPHIVYNGSGYTTLAVVVVHLCRPGAVCDRTVYIRLQTCGVDIAVLAYRSGIVGKLARRINTAVAELVFAGRIHPFGRQRQ